MRVCLLSLVLATALIPTQTVSGLGMQLQPPNPDAIAFDAEWQVYNEPIVVQGLTYYPTRETRMFDGQVMTQVDVYYGVPVYADMSMTPFLLVYVPLTPTRMRTYERGPDGERYFISGRGRFDIPPVGTAGIDAGVPVMMEAPFAPFIGEAPTAPSVATGVESIPPPRVTRGIWVEFDGARWYLDGAAEAFTPDRFVPAGDYHGFPVFRERGPGADRIWIAAVPGGPLTPYKKH